MAGFDKIDDVAKNAFKGGFLDSAYCKKVIGRLNSFCNWTVKRDKNFGVDAADQGIVIRVQQELPDVIVSNASLVLQSINGLLQWGVAQTALAPFSIITQPNPGNPTQTQFGVIFNSNLYSNANTTAPPTIPTETIASGANGLLTSATPSSSDAGWVTWNGSDDYVWLEGLITSGSWPDIASVEIQSLSNGATYDGGDCENDGGVGTPVVYTQTYFRVLIGTLTAPVSPATAPIVKQILNRNLKMYFCSMDSLNSTGGTESIIAAIYPFVCQA